MKKILMIILTIMVLISSFLACDKLSQKKIKEGDYTDSDYHQSLLHLS